jgi:hypothetical protein
VEYNIENIDKFINNVTSIIFEKTKNKISKIIDISVSNIKEKDLYIKLSEIKLIIDEIISKNSNSYSSISEETMNEIIKCISERISSNIMSKLSSEGIIDCAWAENSFTFKKIQESEKINIPMCLRVKSD